jgi:hypothetical protein
LVFDDPLFGALQFTLDEVESVLQDLDVNKGSGPDGIPPIILKNCASAFAKLLSLPGFILSGKVREFKSIWKTHGKVREISKKSSILTFFWKITNFNKNITKKIRSRIFNWYCVLSVAQHC